MAQYLLALLIFVGCQSLAAISIPQSLTKADREETLRILGFGTATRLLTDPYPLGGYSGLEVGLSIENLPTQDLGRLGSGGTTQPDNSFPRISVGKGLFENVDLFASFIPYNQTSQLSLYGGLLRWSLFRSARLPTSLAMVAHGNIANISNIITTRSYGAELVGGLNVGNISAYLSVGKTQASGFFLGGSQGVTDGSREATSENVAGNHFGAGMVLHSWSNDYPVFLAIQVDRYSTTFYSARLGLRL